MPDQNEDRGQVQPLCYKPLCFIKLGMTTGGRHIDSIAKKTVSQWDDHLRTRRKLSRDVWLASRRHRQSG